MNLELRDYQWDGVNEIRNMFRHYQAVLYQLSTGGGKTVVFSKIVEMAVAKLKRVLILVHRKELLMQCSDALDLLGVPHGLIAAGMSMNAEPIQVASVQTLRNRLEKIIRPDLIIVDECHHTSAGSWKKVLDHFCPEIHDTSLETPMNERTRILGVTATPHRLDGKGLGVKSGGYYDVMVKGPSIQELIHRGFLSKPIIYAPPTEFRTADFHTKFGDYDKKEVNIALDNPKIVGNAVAQYKKICPGVPAIAFCVSVEKAKQTAEKFNEAGIPSECLDGKADNYHREYCISGLGDGRIKVLTSCEIISEGVDIPIVTAAIMLRPTKSLTLFLQTAGRVLRPYPGKKNAIILDHVGNVFTHGPVDLVREWSLDGENKVKKKEKGPEILFWQCKHCFTINEKERVYCFTCGEAKDTAKRFIEEIDGELERIEHERLEGVYQEQLNKDRKAEVNKARTMEELYAVAEKMGYKKSWARMRWNWMKRKGIIA